MPRLAEVFRMPGKRACPMPTKRELLTAIQTQVMAIRTQVTDLQANMAALNVKAGKIMAAQDDINAAVAAIQAFFTDLGTAVADIQAELANVAPAVDVSALNALVAQLPAVQASVDALETPPAP